MNGTAVTVSDIAVNDDAKLLLDESLTYAGTFSLGITKGSSTLDLNGNKLKLSGGIPSLSGTIDGSGTLITSGSADLTGGLTLGGTAIWKNDGTVVQTATTTLGDSSGNPSEIVNEANGVFEIEDSSAINIGRSSASEFVNDGTLEIAAYKGVTSSLNTTLISTGTIDVTSGTAQLNATGNVLGGTIEGAGTLQLANGNDTISHGAAITVANFIISNSMTVTLDESLTYAGTFLLGPVSFGDGSATLDLNGKSLTLSGYVQSLSGTIDGGGTLITTHNCTLNGITLGGSTILENSGYLWQAAPTTIGDSSGDAAEIINEAGGTYGLANDGGSSISTNSASRFINDGTLEISSGDEIDARLTSTGTIDILSGIAQFDGNNDVFGGTIEGTELQLIGGTDTIAPGAVITAGTLSIESTASVTLAENLSYAGIFSFESYSESSLALNGHTLTLTGETTIDGGLIVGSGTLVTKGATDLEGVSFDGTVKWENYSTVYQNTGDNFGSSGTVARNIVNELGGVYELSGYASIGSSTDNASLFENLGTVEKMGLRGTSTIYASIENSGTLYAASGTLDVTGAITGSGHLKVGADDVLEFDGSVGSKQAVAFVGSGGELELSDASAFAATIAGFGAKDSIDLAKLGYGSDEKLTFTENSARTNGELVIKDGAKSFSVELFGQYIAADFKLAADGSGTAITYIPPTPHSSSPHLAPAHT